jgi:hypothetical protein
MTRWSATTGTHRSRSALAYGSRSATTADTTSTRLVHGPSPNPRILDRTPEVAGSSPASSMTKGPETGLRRGPETDYAPDGVVT